MFIVGLHRAGSTLLNNIFCASPEIAMAPEEMQLFWPWKKDFIDHAEKIGALTDDDHISQLMDLVYSGEIEASFWDEWKKLSINREEFLEKIKRSDRSYKSIITLFLEEHAKYRKRKRFGAKYLVHFGRIDVLLDWFPDCKIIHLTRDPRAICASKVNDEATIRRKRKSSFLRPFIHYGTLFFFVREFVRSAKIHQQFDGSKNYRLLRYEDLITEPEKTIRDLGAFSDLEFVDEMMFASGKPSSHHQTQKEGFDISRIFYWEQRMTRFDSKLIKLLTKKAMRRLGYGNIEQEYSKWKDRLDYSVEKSRGDS